VGVEDPMRYHAVDLCSFKSLLFLPMSVWNRASLWLHAGLLLVLSLCVAALVVLTVTDHSKLKTHRFQKLSQFLNIFVGLLLGFFMSASVVRWWRCAGGFLKLFDGLRCLQIQLLVLGVPREDVRRVTRYGVISGWILNLELQVEATIKPSEREGSHKHILETFTPRKEKDMGAYTLTEQEAQWLSAMHDKPSQMWVWIFSYLSKLAEDGVIPPMQTPTYTRIMDLAQLSFDAMRTVRTTTSLQAPYIYVQMLAALVHINNIINAVSFGLTLGTAVGTNLTWAKVTWDSSIKASLGQASRDVQDCLVSFFFSCFGPFIYQALLEVAISIATPFSSTDGQIPIGRLLKNLETDLSEAEDMALIKAEWGVPHFKK